METKGCKNRLLSTNSIPETGCSHLKEMSEAPKQDTSPSKESLLRGNRLYPRRYERNFWILSEMRRSYERLVNEYLGGMQLDIIDYGCGNMPYRPLFESQGADYRGYDFEGNDMAFGNLNPDGSLPLPDDATACLVSSQVLEHVADVHLYLSEAKRVLKPNGILFLSTHGVWRYHPDPTDYWRWTGEGLRKLITDAGFEIQELVGVVGPAGSGIQLLQDAIGQKLPRILQKAFFLACQTFLELLDRRCSAEEKAKDSSVYICVAFNR